MDGRALVPVEPEGLAAAVNRLTAAGYALQLQAEDGALVESASGRRLRPEQLVVDETVRIEGPTDPGDEAIVLALREAHGPLRATFVATFGAGASAAEADVLRRLAGPRGGLAGPPARRG